MSQAHDSLVLEGLALCVQSPVSSAQVLVLEALLAQKLWQETRVWQFGGWGCFKQLGGGLSYRVSLLQLGCAFEEERLGGLPVSHTPPLDPTIENTLDAFSSRVIESGGLECGRAVLLKWAYRILVHW